MPKFRFTLTKDVTMSAQVEVEAETMDDAITVAITRDFYQDPAKAAFEFDEGNEPLEVYIPDDDDYTVEVDGHVFAPWEYKAYLQGRRAFEQGLGDVDNPHDPHNDAHGAWAAGLAAAQAEAGPAPGR